MRPRFELVIYPIILIISLTLVSICFTQLASGQPSWPTSWIQVDWDVNEDGWQDDWRDVEYAYYQYDSDYLYLRLECYSSPGSNWPSGNARYKWFIDLNGDLHHSGGNIIGAEYLLFVEDTDDDGNGEIYLLKDLDGDGDFDEYGPWPPSNYADYEVTNGSAGFRITGNYIDMYVSWDILGNPTSYSIDWATDEEDSNLNQASTTDTRDERTPIIVHDVAAITQVVNATTVVEGEIVEVNVTVENIGMQEESFNVTVYFGPTFAGTQRVYDLAAGENTTITFYCDTTGYPPGTYEIRALVDSAAEIVEINETNNWCTSPSTVTVQVHDLEAIRQAANATSVQQGDAVEINVTVANTGNLTETFDVAVYYDNTLLGTKTVSGLSPGAVTNVTFTWDTSGIPEGIYFIKAVVDPADLIDEFNETNNNCTLITPITIYNLTAPGELSVDKALARVISGPDPPVVGYTTVYELMIVVANPGGSDVTDVEVNDTISGDVTFVSLGTPSQGSASYDGTKIIWDVGTLAPGAYANLTFQVSVRPTAPGTLTLNHAADLVASGNDTSTKNIIQDTGETDVNVTAVVRDVEATEQLPLKTTVIRGEVVGINVTVANNGDYYAEYFNVTLYLNDTAVQTLRVFNLAPGETRTLQFAWNTSGVATGNYTIKAFADSGREIAETDENDNNCTAASTIEVVVHDVVAVSQTPSTNSVTKGETLTVDVVVRNDGSKPENLTVYCYYYGALEVVESQDVKNLQPGESRTITFTWDTSGVAPGTYWITAVIDPVDGELDTDDNACTSQTAVTVNAPVGGEIIALSPLAIALALRNVIELLTPLITLAAIIAAISTLIAYIIYKKRRQG